MPISSLQALVEQRPGPLVGRVARDHLEIDRPALQALAPAHHQHFQAVVLGIDRRGQQQRSGGYQTQPMPLGLGSLAQLVRLGHFLGAVPQPGQAGVVEHLHGPGIALLL